MNESELVEGAEYEGNGTSSGRPRRGKLSLAKTAENPFSTPSAALFGVKDGDISPGEPCYVRLDSLRRVEPVVEPAKVAEKDRPRVGEQWETGCPGWVVVEIVRDYGDGDYSCVNLSRWEITGLFGYGERGKSASSTERLTRRLSVANAQRLNGSGPRRCVRCTVEDHGNDCVIDSTSGLCWHCTADDLTKRDFPERPTADDLAQKLRDETLAAEEAKRKHYLERCAAYENQNDKDTHAANWGNSPANIERFKLVSAQNLDAAIARAQPKEEDAPAYVNLNWPPADESDP